MGKSNQKQVKGLDSKAPVQTPVSGALPVVRCKHCGVRKDKPTFYDPRVCPPEMQMEGDAVVFHLRLHEWQEFDK